MSPPVDETQTGQAPFRRAGTARSVRQQRRKLKGKTDDKLLFFVAGVRGVLVGWLDPTRPYKCRHPNEY